MNRGTARRLAADPERDPLVFPSEEHPRWRLRVFDQKWPWRATKGEACDDALASGNAIFDQEGTQRQFYLTSPAAIQRDPPFRSDFIRWRQIQREREQGGSTCGD